ncbi:MAG: PrsW family intramembrane metalloprotease [Anaerolineae bacterium]
MESVVCCVCEKSIEGDVVQLGGRPYCADCHRKVTSSRRSVWWANLIGLAVVVLVVAVVAIAAGAAKPRLEGAALVAVGVILAVVPALLWLAFFYLQDVREPEPKQLVLGVFVLGALLARAVGIPLIEDVFAVSEWMATGLLYRILGAILVVGFTQQFLIYAAVRYSVYTTPEFDERVDGIVYGTAAALGYATMVNIQFVVESGGVALAAGVIRIAVTALALASFGGVMGYFLGRCKFEDEPLWWMPAGLSLAAVLDGLFTYILGEVTSTAVGLRGGGYNPWPGLVLGTVVAGVTFGVLFFLIWRLGRRAPQAVGA